jgi:putative membrane protein
MKLTLIFGATAIAAACTTFAAAAQSTSSSAAPSITTDRTGSSTAGAMHMSAQDYVDKAAMTDMLEVQAGKLASSMSKNSEVKGFADHMVKDHTQTTDMLKKTLNEDTSADLKAPMELDAMHKQMLTQLQKASAANFDKTYMDMQVKGHQDALQLHQDYASGGDDAKLKSFAKEVVPKIQEHLTMAERIDQTLARTASTPSGTSATTGKTTKPKRD